MANLRVLQIVGYKNSGKSTLVASWTKLLAEQGKKVAVIKHHGHEGALELPGENTDSVRFLRAGAASSLVYGDHMIQLHMQDQVMGLKELLNLVSGMQPDVIFVEGFKQEHYPKVVLVKDADEWGSLGRLTRIIAAIAPDGVILDDRNSIRREDAAAVNELLDKWLSGEWDG